MRVKFDVSERLLKFWHCNTHENYVYCCRLDLICYIFQMLFFLFQLFYQTHKYCIVFDIDVFFCHVILCFNSLPNGEYSNLFKSAAFLNKYFSGRTSFPVKNSYLLTFADDKAEILAV